jgi:flagellar hook-length control protein FliK
MKGGDNVETASIVAQIIPVNILPRPGTSSEKSDTGIPAGSFSGLLSSLSGTSKTQAKNNTTDAQNTTDIQTAEPKDQTKKDTDARTLLLSLLQVLQGSLQDSSNTGCLPGAATDSTTSTGSDPTAAVGSLSSAIGQIIDSLQTSGNSGQSEAGFLSLLAGLSGDLQSDQSVSGSTGSTTQDTTTDQLYAALNDLFANADAPTAKLLAAVKATLGQGYPSASSATESDGKATDPAITDLLSTSPDQTTAASGSQTPAKTGGDQATDHGFNLQGLSNPAVAVIATDGSTPAKIGGDQTASLGPDPKTPGNPAVAVSATDGSTPGQTGQDQSSLPGQSKQVSGISGSKETPAKDASFVKPVGSPSTQQAQTSLSQSPGTEEANALLTQPSQQQNSLTSITGPGTVSDSGSQTLGANVINQIVDSAHLLVNNSNNASMSIQLKPEFLGDLKLVVQIEHGIVNASFIAQNQTTASLIAAKLPELRQTLSDQGISWHNLNVSSGGGQGNNQGASSQSQQNMGQAQAQNDYGYPDNTDSNAQPTIPIVYQGAGAGTFNYVV